MAIKDDADSKPRLEQLPTSSIDDAFTSSSGSAGAAAKKIQLHADQMIPISREEFIQGTKLSVDVFVKLENGKFVQVARANGQSSFADLHLAQKEEVNSYFVRKADYKNFVGSNLYVAGVLIGKPEVVDSKKAEVITKTADSVFKEIENLGLNRESFDHAKLISASVQSLVNSKPDLQSVVSVLSEISGDLIRHSMAVSAIATIIGRGMGWTVSSKLEMLALGGILHDIGMKELPREIVSRPRHELTQEERLLYETHVFRGVEILRSMPSVSDDMIAMVFEHHENAHGLGYPRHIRDVKMNPMSRVIALADAFAELTLENVNCVDPKTPEEALNYLETTLGQPFHRPAFQALRQSLLKITRVANVRILK